MAEPWPDQETTQLLGKTWTRWWFQIFVIFTPTWGNNPIWRIFFKRGWNHQLMEGGWNPKFWDAVKLPKFRHHYQVRFTWVKEWLHEVGEWEFYLIFGFSWPKTKGWWFSWSPIWGDQSKSRMEEAGWQIILDLYEEIYSNSIFLIIFCGKKQKLPCKSKTVKILLE